MASRARCATRPSALLRAAADGGRRPRGASPSARGRPGGRDGEGRTPLLLAATHDRVGVARLLVALGADPDALDDRHDTPWLVTGVTGSVAMLEALLPAHPDLTIRNRYGGVSVIPASERGHVAYVAGWCAPASTSTTSTTWAGPRSSEAVILGKGTGADAGLAQAS